MQYPQNLLGVIKAVKPKTALFTTFTVSLSFIDGVLLPQLRQVGCKDIFVLVDASQANRSLAESNSQYAGRHYWVAPVVAPGGGCFHPKLAYFRGEDGDVLTVGSGNLTHSGQSGQLECLDGVSSQSDPGVFRQFASFASNLAARLDERGSIAAEFLREHGERATEVSRGAREGDSDAPFLIHTLDSGASGQIAQAWQSARVPADRLVALSPFHAPDGGPLQRLAKSLGSPAVRVGLDCRTLVAPFERALVRSWKPEFVVPVFAGRERKLHAKVFEVIGAGRSLVVTGSINGTSQSLEQTDNVEVALARWRQGAAFEWETASPKSYVPNDYTAADLAQPAFVLQATLRPDDTLMGRLACVRGEMPQSASAMLLREERRIAGPVNVALNEEGAFEYRLSKELESPAGVQLRLEFAGIEVQCWLNVAEDLRSTDQRRRERQAVRNLLQGHFTEDDVYELLSMLTRAAHGAPAQSRGGTPGAARSKSEHTATDAKFNYKAWRAGLHGAGSSLPSLAGPDAVNALVAWLTKGSETAPPVQDPPPAGGPGSTRRAFRLVDEKSEKQAKRDVRAQFDALLTVIPLALTKEPPPAEGEVLAMVAGAAAVVFMLRGAAVNPWPITRATDWLDQFSRFKYDGDKGRLCTFALSVAALLLAVAEMRNIPAPVARMKDALYRLKSDWSPEDASAEAMKRNLSESTFAQASPSLRERAAALVPGVLNAESANMVLLRIATRARDRHAETRAEDEAVFPGVFDAIKKHFRSKPVPGRAGAVFSTTKELEAGGCFHCSHSLGDDGRRALARKYVAICPECKRPTFYLTDASAADQLRAALRHV